VIYQLINQNAVNTNWDGLAMTLEQNQNVVMPQTAAGTMILGYFNLATQNNLGELAVTSGGTEPVIKRVDALSNQPSIWLHNWNANNLSLTNVSANADTPIWIAAYGPGTPGQTPFDLPADGTPVPLVTTQSAQGKASPQFMQLVLQSNTATLCVFGVIGGPQDSSGNNGYVITVNDAVNGNTGPDTGKAPPPGYYATTSSNTYTFTFNWGSSLVYVVNMSPATASGATVVLRKL